MQLRSHTDSVRRSEVSSGQSYFVRIPSDRTGGAREHEVVVRRVFDELATAANAAVRVNSSVGVHPSPAAVSTTFGAHSASGSDSEDAIWRLQNNRRVFLIRKETAGELSASETDELKLLSDYAQGYVDAREPIPFAELEEFERRVAQRLGEPEP